MIIDSHCHLEYEPMCSSLDDVVERALNNNVKYLLSISTTNDSYLRILEIVKKYKNIYGTYGIHPHETKNYKNLETAEIIKLADGKFANCGHAKHFMKRSSYHTLHTKIRFTL